MNEGIWNGYWLAILFAPLVIWVLLELYSWRKNDPTIPTVSRILVKLFWGKSLVMMVALAAVALVLHFAMVSQDWRLALRLSPLPNWISIRPSDHSVAHWELTDAWYADYSGQYQQSDGTTNVRVIAFKSGRPAIGETAHLYSPSFDITQPTSYDNVSGNAMATFVLGAGESFDPGRGEVGYDCFKMDGVSDSVCGVGLPLRQHVQHWGVFEFKDGAVVITPTPITPVPVITPSGACDLLPISGVRICK